MSISESDFLEHVSYFSSGSSGGICRLEPIYGFSDTDSPTSEEIDKTSIVGDLRYKST